MAIDVDTKDCTALSDAELEEMADLAGDEPVLFDIGVLSKERDSWVLVTQARNGDKLYGFAFSTLERIGGTPSVLVGLASVKRSSRADTALRAIVGDLLRRAVLAFPDEDVLIGARMVQADAMEVVKTLDGVIPRPDHRANGEERAWGRRLVKRFGIDGSYDDREFRVTGSGVREPVFDYVAPKPEKVDDSYADLFADLDVARGDCVIVHGWAMAEDLAKLL